MDDNSIRHPQTDQLLGAIKRFKMMSEYENALNEHRKTFKPHQYGVDRRNFVDHDLAFAKHMVHFDDPVKRDHYDDTPEEQAEYDRAVQEAREAHAEKFDPKQWHHLDEVMRPEYFQALQQAMAAHDSKFQYAPPAPEGTSL